MVVTRQAGREQAPTEEIRGAVEHVIFHDEDSGYTVCSVQLTPAGDPVTVVGTCPSVFAGETLTAEGHWVRHPQHGRQFQADRMACAAPVTRDGIRRYLSGGMIKGIGPELAGRLVNAFGEDTLRVIDRDSARLLRVPGIGPKRRDMIKASWRDERAVRDIMVFLHSHGLGSAMAARIHRQYRDDAIQVVSRNPYRLCREVWGIGFKSADRIAASVGIPRDSEIRARAGLAYLLQAMTEEGHCFCPREPLLDEAGTLLEIPRDVLAQALDHEVAAQTLVEEDARVYLAPLHQAEVRAAAKVRRLQAVPAGFRPIQAARAVAWAEKRMRLRLDPSQADALRMALAEKVSIITGGPGVGKTTIVRALVDVFRARRLAVSLAAPTGRAAKRLEEATGAPASTVHRLLKFIPQTGYFEHGANKPLKGDVFILDEMSMVDILLFHAFVRALPDSSCLVLVGDVDQLPSVGPGNVLRDLLDSGVIPWRRLATIFRQERGGWIVHNAHRVNQGQFLELPEPGAPSDFYFIEASEPDQVLGHVRELVSARIPRRFHFDPRRDVQVLTPMRRNQLGAENLNVVLQEALNPAGRSLERFGWAYRVGDRVMQIRNNYDKDVFNGDIGWVRELDEGGAALVVEFDGRRLRYETAELDELVPAYACSIHKSQGSEYPAVVILMTTQHYKLLQRNLLYTALTRGRRLVCLVGSRKAVGIAIRNDRIAQRRTGLRERLTGGGRERRAPPPPGTSAETRA